MSAEKLEADRPADRPAARPASGARQLVSLLLALHCLCVVLALASSLSPSPLQLRLKVVLAPYTTTLHLDPAPATFYWTHGGSQDAGHHVEVLTAVEGGTEWRRAAEFTQGTPARLRQLRAARTLAELVEEDAEEDVARLVRDTVRWADQQGLSPKGIRLRRQNLQRAEEVAGANQARRSATDPSFFETLYEADVLIADGRVSVVKRTPAGEAAQVVPVEDAP